MKPQWQKARILESKAFPQVKDAIIFVKAKPPQLGMGYSMETGRLIQGLGHYEMNVVDDDSECIRVRANTVELLPEFAETVEMVKWEDFVNGK